MTNNENEIIVTPRKMIVSPLTACMFFLIIYLQIYKYKLLFMVFLVTECRPVGNIFLTQ